ncbi:hypothetical protein NC652_026299 [Populus alba x Populus x berolinensis]|nr:hypothetical protein NC652_026299 [Populus alba x Populus x berolinensis]
MVFGKRTLDSADGRKLPVKEQPTRCPDQNAARHCERKDCVHFKLGFLFVGPNGGFIQGHLRLSLIAYGNWSTEGYLRAQMGRFSNVYLSRLVYLILAVKKEKW